jgi:formate hydrogenlyase transcriptional activator
MQDDDTLLALQNNDKAEEYLHTMHRDIDRNGNFLELVGNSASFTSVLQEVRSAASNDATILIIGETGTGKELIARTIHRLSARRIHSFLKLNCARIPADLLESELFGQDQVHPRGAIRREKGRFEMADEGILFLDEIGDLPADLQPKVLRALQQQTFERQGGTPTIKVNVRLVAATTHDLAARVAAGRFRSDLYHQLNVSPIRTPSLRERREDIAGLAHHFTRVFARLECKQIDTISAESMESLVKRDWPGNIRELENLIYRSVVLTPGSVLQLATAPEVVKRRVV